MRLSNARSGRLQYYDRAPTDVSINYINAGLAPAASTVRASYTVPANRAARLEALLVSLYRATAAGASGRATAIGAIVPSGGTQMDIAIALLSSNTVDAGDKQAIGDAGHLIATDVVRLITADASTTGTLSFDLSAKITEFDA